MTRKQIPLPLMAAVMLSLPFAATAAPSEISGLGMNAVWQDGCLNLRRSDSDQSFLIHTDENSSGATEAVVRSVNDPTWGQGQAIRLQQPSGDQTQVTLFPTLPFAVWQRTLVNTGDGQRVVNKDSMLSAKLDLGVPPAQLKTISTAGLLDVADHPGGYTFMAVGDPNNHRGIVCGWSTHHRGSGIVFSDVIDSQATLQARIDYGDLRIEPQQQVKTETLLIGFFDDIRLGLEQYGDAIAKQLNIRLPDQPSVYCTWYHDGASDEQKIARNTDFVHDQLVPYGFHVVQIDDKWQAGQSQNGPRKDFSKILADGPYPSGMKKTADYVRSQGLVPGIWFMPFAGTWNDPYWADKLDLFYKEGRSPDNHINETNGGKRPDFPAGEAPFVARWGGTCLDMTNPKTQQYLRSIVQRMAHEWGYEYFKMDGLWTGTGAKLLYVNSSYQDDDLGQTTRFDPTITPIEAYAKGLDLVRQTAGPDAFFLGCCAPQNMRSFGPAMGRVDAMRVGPDNGALPERLVRGPLFSTRVFFLNKRVWYNDPDPVYVRPSFPEPMAQTSVSWTALTGSLHSSSYSYYELPADRLDILRRGLPSHTLKTVRPVDYLENDPAQIWLLTDERDPVRKDVVGLFNWDISKSAKLEYPLERLGVPQAEKYVGFDFWNDRFVPPFSETVAVDLKAGGCAMLALRPAQEHPQVISTSRHVTQGVVDLRNEHWDDATATLSGVSEVIGGEDYELRIVVPTGKASWQLKDVVLADLTDTTEMTAELSGPTVRVRIRSAAGGQVRWSAQFEPSEVRAEHPEPVNELEATVDFDQVSIGWKPSSPYGYRVLRDGVSMAEIGGMSYQDGTVKFGMTYDYAVQTRGWDGQWSEARHVTAVMPKQVETPEQPPLPQVFLSDLKPAKSSTGWGRIGIDKSSRGIFRSGQDRKHAYFFARSDIQRAYSSSSIFPSLFRSAS
ncbi:alpha-amylase family protein [Novipirellula artificiosorum]|uniref:Alpha-galactosidase n=1 Tax=Novipirellula artificiosorum TaxID=2528016 RepID=A0A5C6D4J5_9BACT|nr:hypothetical protein [Novipirellula artificiosorum]TWU30587.1 hypothetical protein Poly41_66820 [Novipirellula artificiosorum]